MGQKTLRPWRRRVPCRTKVTITTMLVSASSTGWLSLSPRAAGRRGARRCAQPLPGILTIDPQLTIQN